MKTKLRREGKGRGRWGQKGDNSKTEERARRRISKAITEATIY